MSPEISLAVGSRVEQSRFVESDFIENGFSVSYIPSPSFPPLLSGFLSNPTSQIYTELLFLLQHPEPSPSRRFFPTPMPLLCHLRLCPCRAHPLPSLRPSLPPLPPNLSRRDGEPARPSAPGWPHGVPWGHRAPGLQRCPARAPRRLPSPATDRQDRSLPVPAAVLQLDGRSSQLGGRTWLGFVQCFAFLGLWFHLPLLQLCYTHGGRLNSCCCSSSLGEDE